MISWPINTLITKNNVKSIWLGLPDRDKRYLSIVFYRMWDFEKFFPFIDRCFPGIIALEVVCNNYLARSDDEPCTFEGIPKSIQYLRWTYGHVMTLSGLHCVKWLDFAAITPKAHWHNHCSGYFAGISGS